MRATERVEPPVIENGTGLTAAQILLLDGLDYEVTVIDNTAVTPPIAGTVGSILIPALGVNGVITTAQVSALVINSNVALAKKQPGERVIALKTYVLFTPA